MRSYEHTHTADLSASLSCSAAVADRAPGQSAHGGHAFTPMDAERAGDIPASFRDMMRRLLERREFSAIVAVANDLLADHPDSLYLHFGLGQRIPTSNRTGNASVIADVSWKSRHSPMSAASSAPISLASRTIWRLRSRNSGC